MNIRPVEAELIHVDRTDMAMLKSRLSQICEMRREVL